MFSRLLIDFVQANYGTNDVRRDYGTIARILVTAAFRFGGRSSTEIVRNFPIILIY